MDVTPFYKLLHSLNTSSQTDSKASFAETQTTSYCVIPGQTGIQENNKFLDSRRSLSALGGFILSEVEGGSDDLEDCLLSVSRLIKS